MSSLSLQQLSGDSRLLPSAANIEMSILEPIVCDSGQVQLKTLQKFGCRDRMKECWSRCVEAIGNAICHPRGRFVIVGGMWTIAFGVFALTSSEDSSRITHGVISAFSGIVTCSAGIANARNLNPASRYSFID